MKVSRNAPCPCGSGKKYKKCCLLEEQKQTQAASAAPKEEAFAIEAPVLMALTPDVVCQLREGKREFVVEMADQASQGIGLEELLQAVAWLAYFGNLSLATEAGRRAWSDVFQEEIQPWQKEYFLETALVFEMVEHQNAHHEEPFSIESTEAIERLSQYVEDPKQNMDMSIFQSNILHLTGQAQSSWEIKDFAFKNRKQRTTLDWDNYTDEDIDAGEGIEFQIAADPAREKLSVLTSEFVHSLHQAAGISVTKGELARQCWEKYILLRADGNLRQHTGADAGTPFSSKAKRKPAKKRKGGQDHRLLPDKTTLERFLADRFGLFSGILHLRAFAMMESLPHWFAFLLSRGLIEEYHRDRGMRELKEIAQKTVMFAETYFASQSDLVEGFQDWYEKHWGEKS